MSNLLLEVILILNYYTVILQNHSTYVIIKLHSHNVLSQIFIISMLIVYVCLLFKKEEGKPPLTLLCPLTHGLRGFAKN